MTTRREFLSDNSHRIRFVYLPKHSSWLNQIEIFFGIVHRKCRRGGNFTSVPDLESQLRQFITYYCVGSAGMGQTGLLDKLGTGNKNCEWIYRFRANPGRPWGGIVPPTPVLAPGSALGSRPRVALSSAQAPSM